MLKILLKMGPFTKVGDVLVGSLFSMVVMFLGLASLRAFATETDPGTAVLQVLLGIVMILMPAALFFTYGLVNFVAYQQFAGTFGVSRPLSGLEREIIRPVVVAQLAQLRANVAESERRFHSKHEEREELHGAMASYRECFSKLEHAELLARLFCPIEEAQGILQGDSSRGSSSEAA